MLKVHLLKADGGHAGPYDLDEVRALFQAGRITRETPYWREGMPQWRPVGELLETALAPISPAAIAGSYGDILDNLTRSPLIDGAAQREQSKIVMAVESIRHGNLSRADDLFHAALAENHSIAAGWLGLAYLEAESFGVGKAEVRDLRLAVDKARPFCSQGALLDDCYGQIILKALMAAVTLTTTYLTKFGHHLMSAGASMSSAKDAAANRDLAVLAGTAAAVFTHRSKGAVSQFLGTTVAITAGVQAFEKHFQVRAHQADAKIAERERAEAEKMLFAAACSAYEAYQEAAQESARFSLKTRKEIEQLRQPVGKMLKDLCQLQVILLARHLPLVMDQCIITSYVKENIAGTPETSSFVKRMTSLGLGRLPLTTDVASLFGDLDRLCQDVKLKAADKREHARRTTQMIVSILMFAVGFLAFLYSCSVGTGDSGNGPAPRDGIAPQGSILIGSFFLFLLGFIGILGRPTSLFPSRRALRARVAKTIETYTQTRILAEDLHLGNVATLHA